MSIYSGFPTREAETSYNKLICRLITTMQEHILLLSNGKISAHFSNKYTKIIARMLGFEEHKYLPPKLTILLKPLEEAMRESLAIGMNNAVEESIREGSKSSLKDLPQKLEAVKEEEELPSSRNDKIIVSTKGDRPIRAKFELVEMNKTHSEFNRRGVSHPNKIETKSKQMMLVDKFETTNEQKKDYRSHSVFSEKNPSSEVMEQINKNNKIRSGVTMTNFSQKKESRDTKTPLIKNRYMNKNEESQNETVGGHRSEQNSKTKKNGLMKSLTEAVQRIQ